MMQNMVQHIRIGSRRSRLAQRQAHICRDLILPLLPSGSTAEVLTFQTSGDAYQTGNLSEIGTKGLFTKEIEEALLRDDIDVAVHSMKDVATVLPEGLIIPSILPRDDVRDVLLCQNAKTLADIKQGAVIGTSSLRRAVQISYGRPDISVVSYRGNLDRRISRLEAGTVDASLLAAAGLERLAITLPYATPLDIDAMLPAVAQGAIGLQCRQTDTSVIDVLSQMNHMPTLQCVTTERTMLRTLDGSCRTPIAGYATLKDGNITLRGLLANTRGTMLVRDSANAPIEDAQELGIALAQRLRMMLDDARASA